MDLQGLVYAWVFNSTGAYRLPPPEALTFAFWGARLMIEILSMTLRTLNYGNYGIFLIMGNAGCISSAVGYIEFIAWGFRLQGCSS